MDKIQFMRLWDLYGKLLTPTQQEITHLYLNLDLTVSEIADEKGISRQGVSDCISTCKKELLSYEQRLGHGKMLASEDIRAEQIISDVAGWARQFSSEHPEYAQDITRLNAILGKN